MDNILREDIRGLIRSFAIQADEAVLIHLIRTRLAKPLRARLVLEDLTGCGEEPPAEPLHLDIEGTLRPCGGFLVAVTRAE